MPFFAGLGVAVVLFAASYFGRPDLGLVALIGTNVFLYIPSTSIYHRMIVLMSCGFAMSLAFSIGLLGQMFPFLIPLIVGLTTMMASMLVRYYDLGSPGYFPFVLACVLGANIPFQQSDYIMLIGLVNMGAIVSNVLGFIYCILVVYVFKNNAPTPVPERGKLGFDVIVIDPIIIGTFVGLAMLLGELLFLERSYWVSMSCAVVMQGLTFRAVWLKQVQRIVDTIIGVALAYYLLSIRFSGIEFALMMMILTFMTEFLVVRNYALAIIFITPYVTYLAEVANFMNYDPDVIIKARIIDVVIGSAMGCAGGFFLHHAPLRRRISVVARLILRRWHFW